MTAEGLLNQPANREVTALGHRQTLGCTAKLVPRRRMKYIRHAASIRIFEFSAVWSIRKYPQPSVVEEVGQVAREAFGSSQRRARRAKSEDHRFLVVVRGS